MIDILKNWAFCRDDARFKMSLVMAENNNCMGDRCKVNEPKTTNSSSDRSDHDIVAIFDNNFSKKSTYSVCLKV
jgi:hypothetical protein